MQTTSSAGQINFVSTYASFSRQELSREVGMGRTALYFARCGLVVVIKGSPHFALALLAGCAELSDSAALLFCCSTVSSGPSICRLSRSRIDGLSVQIS